MIFKIQKTSLNSEGNCFASLQLLSGQKGKHEPQQEKGPTQIQKTPIQKTEVECRVMNSGYITNNIKNYYDDDVSLPPPYRGWRSSTV